MTDKDLEAVKRSVGAVTAPRKFVFSDPDVERVLDITMALAGELAVTRERLDTVERLLQEKSVMTQDEIEGFDPTGAPAEARLKDHDAMITRILRVLHHEIATMKEAKGS